jgi:hypothetical protein
MNYSVDEVEEIMITLMLSNTKQRRQCYYTINRMLRNFYGVSASIILKIWNLIKINKNFNSSAGIIHLMWMFSYFKSYTEYEQYSAKFGCCVPTFRSWVWYMAKQVSELPLVSN